MSQRGESVTPQQIAIVFACLLFVAGLVCLAGSYDRSTRRDNAPILRGVSAVLCLAGIAVIIPAIASQRRRSSARRFVSAWANGAFVVPAPRRTRDLAALSESLGRSLQLPPELLPDEITTAGQLSDWLHTRLSNTPGLCYVPGAATRIRSLLSNVNPIAANADLQTRLSTLISRGSTFRTWQAIEGELGQPLPPLVVTPTMTWTVRAAVVTVLIVLMGVTAMYLDNVAPMNAPQGTSGIGRWVAKLILLGLLPVGLWVVARFAWRWLLTFPESCNTIYGLAAHTARPDDAGWTREQVSAQVFDVFARVRKVPSHHITAATPLA